MKEKSSNPTYISTFHDIPSTSKDLEYIEGETFDDLRSAVADDEYVGPSPSESLSPPSRITLKSQVVEQGENGSQTVTATFEVEEVIGATNYQLRVAFA